MFMFVSRQVYIFAFTCHQNIFGVCNELADFSVPKANSVIRTSIGSSAFIYVVVAVAGYSTYGTEVRIQYTDQ